MRIVQAGHFQFRKYGKAQVSTELKLFNGFVRLNHNVQIFSERDTAAFEAPFGWRNLGKKKANRRLVETCDNFQPDLLILGHCDIIKNETLSEIRGLLPALRIACRNVDALFVESNVARIRYRAPLVDHLFPKRRLSGWPGSFPPQTRVPQMSPRCCLPAARQESRKLVGSRRASERPSWAGPARKC